MDENAKEEIRNILSFENNEWTIKKRSSVNRIFNLLLVLALFIATVSLTLIIHFQEQSNKGEEKIQDVIFQIQSTNMRKYYFQSISKDGQVYLRDIHGLNDSFQPFKLPSNSQFQYFYEFNGELHALHYSIPDCFKTRTYTYLTYLENGKVTLTKNYYLSFNTEIDRVFKTKISYS